MVSFNTEQVIVAVELHKYCSLIKANSRSNRKLKQNVNDKKQRYIRQSLQCNVFCQDFM